jgi:hypothetical protein
LADAAGASSETESAIPQQAFKRCFILISSWPHSPASPESDDSREASIVK